MRPETITEYVEHRKVTLTVDAGPTVETDDAGWEHNAYTVSLHRDGETITTPYQRGMSLPPLTETTANAAEVLNALLSDAEAGGEDFEDFCGNFGFDTDSRRAWKTWESCSATRLRLIGFVGTEDFFDVLPNVERL